MLTALPALLLAVPPAPPIDDDPLVVILSPPPGSQTSLPSAEIQGLVVPDQVIEPFDEVFIRTRYANGTFNPPLASNGAYEPDVLGWSYTIDWDPLTGLGYFTGRAQWLDAGVNFIDVYLPGDTLGSPNYTQQINFQQQAVNITDVVAGIHPLERTIDVVREDGSSGGIEFLVDLINTTDNQTYTIDLAAQVELPDGTLVDLPMGESGNTEATYTLAPGDFAFTSIIDPVGMLFEFPLDQPPFPQPVQEGAYKMEVRCFSGAALIYLDEDIDFWVTDRTDAPFREVTDQAGLDQVYLQGGSRPEVGNSLAVFDYDGDGLTDLFASNPSGSQTFLPIGPNTPFPGGRNYLMRNNGDGTFSDVTEAAGVVGNTSKGSYGATWGDFNRDGYNDLIVANRGLRPYVYKNEGDGTFTNLGTSFIGSDNTGWDFAPRAGDIDLDGDLDVFIGTYLDKFDTTWQLTGFPSELYVNGLAEGSLLAADPSWPLFVEGALAAGVQKSGTTLAAFFADYDRDGAIDLAVHNDFGAFTEPNELYRGSNDGSFVETSGPSQYDRREFSMGGTATDFNGDGWLDSYSSSIGRNSLLLNDGTGDFISAIEGSGAEGDFMVTGPQADGVFLDDNWGVMSWDYDLDGDWDLYVGGSDLFTTYNMPIAELHPDSVFENDGTAQFTRAELDLGLANAARTRSVVAFDYDLDGDLDVISSAENEGLTLMRNDLVADNNWVRIRPVTYRSAPGGFNTKLTSTAPGIFQFAEVMAESSHSSSGDNAITFGIGTEPRTEILAEWQRGGTSTLFRAVAGQETRIHETLVLIDDQIHAEVQAGQPYDVELLGRPGLPVIAAIDDPGVDVGFPVPSGGALDIWPLLQTPLTWITVLDPDGRADWPLPPVGPNLIGLTLELQSVTYDVAQSIFDVKSGVSTLTAVP